MSSPNDEIPRTSALPSLLEARAQRDRLVMAGLVATCVAHDVLNFLSVPMAALTGEAAGEVAADNRRALGSARDLLQRLLRLARPTSAKPPALVDVGGTVADVLSLAGAAKMVRVDHRVDGRLPPVRAVSMLLEQVFLNLVLNALAAMEGPPEAPGHVLRSRVRAEGAWVVVEIQDTGGGIPPELLDQVFEPFVTTKGPRGSGLGLHISRTIVEELGGSLELVSTEGRGTTARVLLPAPGADAPEGRP